MSKVCVLLALPMMLTLLACGASPHPETIEIGNPSTDGSTFALGFASTSGRSDYSGALSTPGQAIVVNSKLIVADTDHNRILIWNSLPTASLQAADVVLGNNTLVDLPTAGSAPTQSNMNTPGGVASDGTKLVVADTGWHRVLIWNTIPTTNGALPNVVIGQNDFVSASANGGSVSTTAKGLHNPQAVYINGGKLYVGDSDNNRVLVYNTIPVSSGTSADFALGQADLLSGDENAGGGAASRDANTLRHPTYLTATGTKLIVSDSFNDRVLIWNDLTTIGMGSAADNVVGQGDFTSDVPAASMDGLTTPYGVDTDGTKLFVADSGNHRALIYNVLPATDGTAADVLLGQAAPGDADFNQGLQHPQADTMNAPMGITVAGGALYLADTWNSRILKWSTVPAASQTAADSVLGQVTMKRAVFGQPLSGVTATAFLTPRGSFYDGSRFYVADSGNNRVLIYSSVPTTSSATPTYVLGQTDFVSGDINAGGSALASTLYSPTAVYSDGTHLFVADTGNNRVLKWDTIPTSNGAAASVVIGQPDKTTVTQGLTATKLAGPTGVFVSGTKLFVNDQSNRRVMIWNTLPTLDNTGANVTMGAPDATHTPAGAGHWSQEFVPGSVCSDGTRVYVSDITGYRVMAWNAIPTADYATASFSLGQVDTVTRGDTGTESLSHVALPYGMTINGGKLYVAEDTGRVKIWNALTGASGQTADHFFGQASATTTVLSAASSSSLRDPRGVNIVGDRMAITDTGFNRILFVPFTREH